MAEVYSLKIKRQGFLTVKPAKLFLIGSNLTVYCHPEKCEKGFKLSLEVDGETVTSSKEVNCPAIFNLINFRTPFSSVICMLKAKQSSWIVDGGDFYGGLIPETPRIVHIEFGNNSQAAVLQWETSNSSEHLRSDVRLRTDKASSWVKSNYKAEGADLNEGRIRVSGLRPLTDYEFQRRTCIWPHTNTHRPESRCEVQRLSVRCDQQRSRAPSSRLVYSKEQKPVSGPNLSVLVHEARRVHIQWDELPVDQQRGFITHYTSICRNSTPATLNSALSASTSAGEGQPGIRIFSQPEYPAAGLVIVIVFIITLFLAIVANLMCWSCEFGSEPSFSSPQDDPPLAAISFISTRRGTTCIPPSTSNHPRIHQENPQRTHPC
ncbi:hypothetical protein F7725_027581 [Dissostichus mawsoni]|uniref:Fibronectin type-III domain-containing protein n=1 Tax=Dissostichus mawsoni TaxID=36200 RepID=A0A7J5XDU2_DISMA|nr:hypothetical protein F7725_027581 [Dissostichus mawsoni]